MNISLSTKSKNAVFRATIFTNKNVHGSRNLIIQNIIIINAAFTLA